MGVPIIAVLTEDGMVTVPWGFRIARGPALRDSESHGASETTARSGGRWSVPAFGSQGTERGTSHALSCRALRL